MSPRRLAQRDELAALEKSIESQGILVPLTVFEDGGKFSLLMGSGVGDVLSGWGWPLCR